MASFLRRTLFGGNNGPERVGPVRDASENRETTGQGSLASNDLQQDLMCRLDTSRTPFLDAVRGPQPFENGASRGDFVWALARQEGHFGTREDAIIWAEKQGIMTGGRTEDPVSRAEAATILVRHLALDTALPEGQVAYFSDVSESDWYFETAHTARRFGIFVGANNQFMGGDALTADQAKLILDRTDTASIRTPEEQSPGLAPLLEPSGLEQLLSADELDYTDVAKARELITKLPEDQRPEAYRRLAASISYRNQRDNDGKYADIDAAKWGYRDGADVMCNVTSLAMALNQLGLGADESDKQFEDALDEQMWEEDLGSRYTQQGQAGVAAKYGADTERMWVPDYSKGDSMRTWYEDNVLPRLQQGASATLSIQFGKTANSYHIVRLEWVESEGLRVDDPYGAIYNNGSYYTFDRNEVDTSEDGGAKGEDDLWSWQTVAAINGGRYVQFYTT